MCSGFTIVCHAGGVTLAQYILWQPSPAKRLFGVAIGHFSAEFGSKVGAKLVVLAAGAGKDSSGPSLMPARKTTSTQ